MITATAYVARCECGQMPLNSASRVEIAYATICEHHNLNPSHRPYVTRVDVPAGLMPASRKV